MPWGHGAAAGWASAGFPSPCPPCGTHKLQTFALCLLWGYHSAGGKEGTQPWDKCQDTAWLDPPALGGSGGWEGPQLHPHPQGCGSSSWQQHMLPALPTAPLHLGLSVPSFTTCSGLN